MKLKDMFMGIRVASISNVLHFSYLFTIIILFKMVKDACEEYQTMLWRLMILHAAMVAYSFVSLLIRYFFTLVDDFF